MEQLLKLFFLPFRAIGTALLFLFQREFFRRTEGAKLADKRDYGDRLNARNTGLLMDGDTLKMSERESFQNVCVIARVGAGKTSRYIIPNVIERAKYPCSVIVNDPKGEVFDATSGHMKKHGFRVIVIDPEHPDRSHRFNPLTEARDMIELDQVAEILIKAGKGGQSQGASSGSGDFWAQGAIRFVSVFLGCLRNAGRDNPAFNTLANLYYLFQNFGEDGSALDAFMARYSVNPDNPQDSRLWNEWQGVLTGNKEGVQSFVLNAITALSAMRQEHIALVTSESSFALEELRREKTVVYFITPPQHAEYYGFLTSLFFRSVFNALMRELPPKDTRSMSYLPCYVLYDEFGHSTIPNFVSTANTIRGYRVSLSIVLQSIAQLSARYGRDYAQSIQGGFNTAIAYAGSDPETAMYFEKLAGKTRVYQYHDPTAGSGHRTATSHHETYREQNLMNAGEVRTMASDAVLIVSGNQQPALIPSKGYFEVGRLRRATSLPSVPVEVDRAKRPEWVGL
jgi:type IV secretory pathway TraG/TraD family ATPase VirD4